MGVGPEPRGRSPSGALDVIPGHWPACWFRTNLAAVSRRDSWRRCSLGRHRRPTLMDAAKRLYLVTQVAPPIVASSPFGELSAAVFPDPSSKWKRRMVSLSDTKLGSGVKLAE